MAIVANLALSGAPNPGGTNLDKPYHTWNRANAGSPVAALVPQFVGEIVIDTTNNNLWKAIGLTNAYWVPYGARIT